MVPSQDDRGTAVEGLTVSEMIEHLRTLDPGSMVVIEGRYGGFDCVKAALKVDIVVNVNGDPDFGPHEMAEHADHADLKAVALVSRRVLDPA